MPSLCTIAASAPCREAAKMRAALRPCAKREREHEADSNGVWGPWPQETFYNSYI